MQKIKYLREEKGITQQVMATALNINRVTLTGYERGRRLLQYVGTDVIRAKIPDYWVDFIAVMLSLFPDTWDYVLIADSRFPNEIQRLKDAGLDTLHLRVVRGNFISPLTIEQQLFIIIIFYN